MDAQYNSKKLAALFVTILFCGVSVLYAGKDGESVSTESLEPKEAPEVLGRRGIRGADIQVAEEDIRNPFTAVHERAGEDCQVQAVSKEAKLSPEPSAARTTMPLTKLPEKPKPQEPSLEPMDEARPAEPELCGIMQGDDGKVALLRIGGQTAVLSVGETFQDWLLVQIGEGLVILRRDWQDKCLYLRSYYYEK